MKPEIKVLKYYKSLDTLPVYNFIKILEDADKNIGYMLIFDVNEGVPELDVVYRVFLFEKWKQLLYELPELDSDFMDFYNLWKQETLAVSIKKQKNNIINLSNILYAKKEKLVEIKYSPAFLAFSEYLKQLNAKYTNFKISYYEFNEVNFNKIKKPKKADKILDFKKQFFFREEYDLFVNDADLQLTTFFNQIYDIKHDIFSDLTEYSKYMTDFFMNEYQDLTTLVLLRGVYFDHANLQKMPVKEEFNFFEDIAVLNFITKQQLDVKKNSVQELFATKKLAEKISKKNK